MDECEEGEIVDFDDEEEVYRPLERPTRPDPSIQVQRPRMVESDSDEVTESSSDSDSSSGPRSAKKRKMHRVKPPHQSRRDGPPAGFSGARNRKYNVWTASVQEDTIATELEQFDGLQKFSRERGVESYDFTLRRERMSDDEEINNSEDSNHGNVPDNTTEEMSLDSNSDLRSKLSNKRRYDERGRVKQRLGRQPSPSDYPFDCNDLLQERIIKDLTSSPSDSAEEIAHDIAKKLVETKEELILRIINTAGKEKAISVFQQTQKVESEGGMLIMNGSRRRSPGGVFFFLIKNDDDLSKQDKDIIFDEDIRHSLSHQRKLKKAAQRKRVEEERQKLSDEIVRNANLPNLLTRAEIAVQQATAKNSKTHDGSVSNPPPSPATDNRGESSNDSPPHRLEIPLNSRNIAEYDDDFIDVYAEDMDEF